MTSSLFRKNQINFVSFMNNIYKELCLYKFVDHNEQVIVTDMEYFKKLAEILDSTDPQTIANYFGWITVSQFGIYTTNRFRQIQSDFSQSLAPFPLKIPNLDNICSELLQTTIPWTLSRRYIDQYFDKADKNKVINHSKFYLLLIICRVFES